MYRPKQGSYHKFLTVYNECIGKGMQHEDIARHLNMGMMEYWTLHSNAEASELEYGRFIPCPPRFTKSETKRKDQLAAMKELLADL